VEQMRADGLDGYDNRPIGVFDSGYGGLTVARALQKRLPEESLVYFGDSARCPYGPRDQAEVDRFVQQICTWLLGHDVKMIVIACNTATAAGLAHAQRVFPVPVVGVVEPGARAAAHATLNRRVGVIATKGTVESNDLIKQTARVKVMLKDGTFDVRTYALDDMHIGERQSTAEIDSISDEE